MVDEDVINALIDMSIRLENNKNKSCETCKHYSVSESACVLTMDSCCSECIYYDNINN